MGNAFDNLLTIRIKKGFKGINKDIYIFIVYWKPVLKEDAQSAELDKITLELTKYQTNGYTLFVGDFNGRTNAKSEDKPERSRSSYDKTNNSQGDTIMKMCVDSDHILLNGRCPGDLLGSLTYYRKNSGESEGISTVDYIITDKELFPLVEYMCVHKKVLASDHCLLEASFRFPASASAPDPKRKLTIQALMLNKLAPTALVSTAADVLCFY